MTGEGILAPPRLNFNSNMESSSRTSNNININANYIPEYNGDSQTLYVFLKAANQFLAGTGGPNPQNVTAIISRITGRAAAIISMIEHNFDWKFIVSELKKECGDNRDLESLQSEIANMRKGPRTYKDFIFELKQKLFFIKSRLQEDYEDDSIVHIALNPYVNTALIALKNNLPFNEQLCLINANFEQAISIILKLEAEGRFSQQRHQTITNKQTNNNSLPRGYPHANYQHNQPHFRYQGFSNNAQRHSYPPTARSLQQKQHRPWQPVSNQNNWHYRPQYHNDTLNRPKYPYPSRPNFPNNSARVTQQLKDQDVSMRSVLPRNNASTQPGQINLGRGMVAEEIFQHETETQVGNDENFHEISEENDLT